MYFLNGCSFYPITLFFQDNLDIYFSDQIFDKVPLSALPCGALDLVSDHVDSKYGISDKLQDELGFRTVTINVCIYKLKQVFI